MKNRAPAQDENYKLVSDPNSDWWKVVMAQVETCLLWFGEAGATTEELCQQTMRSRNTVSPAVAWLKREGRAFHSGRVRKEGGRHGVVWVGKREWCLAKPEQMGLMF